MSVTTKGGDKGGQTSLYSGQRVSKDDIRIETVGTGGDELVSNLASLSISSLFIWKLLKGCRRISS